MTVDPDSESEGGNRMQQGTGDAQLIEYATLPSSPPTSQIFPWRRIGFLPPRGENRPKIVNMRAMRGTLPTPSGTRIMSMDGMSTGRSSLLSTQKT